MHRFFALFFALLAIAPCSFAQNEPLGTPSHIEAAASTPVFNNSDSEALTAAPPVDKAEIPDRPPEVVKYGRHFMLMDQTGLMPRNSKCGYGLYCNDTRYLKSWDMKLNWQQLTRLYGRTDQGYAGRYLYGNKADEHKDYELPEQKILVEREIVITDGIYEKIKLDNYDTRDRHVELAVSYDSDFADMFEVRGYGRKKRGWMMPTTVDAGKSEVTLAYKGLDGNVMRTRISFSGMKPDELTADHAIFHTVLKPRTSITLWSKIDTEGGAIAGNREGRRAANDPLNVTAAARDFEAQKEQADRRYSEWRDRGATISTDNTAFNQLLERGYRDIYMLKQPTPKGDCIAAGIPWFAVAFGRDQEITSLETLPLLPQLTRQTIDLLAQYQGAKDDSYTEEHLGRIMHELRLGEMARMKEIPFIPYYGTVDATPLFLVLLGEYVQWTGDVEFARRHWDDVEHALAYLDRETTKGYLTYGEKKDAALSNQGWKDSGDSVMYGNGELAHPPIALCEVQGYLYKAWVRSSELAKLLKHDARAKELRDKADALRSRFQNDFWNEHEHFVALALDGEGKQCDVVSSNPGHLLFTGILSDTQAKAVADRLMEKDSSCGWGIRTLSSKEKAFNPLSYHDGSVWPHDNAMIVRGLAAISETKYGASVGTSLFKVAQHEPNLRLPELFCGFTYPEGPVWYPVACSPQAWAAGSMFMILSSCLGLEPDAIHHRLTIKKPEIPKPLSQVDIKGLRVGKGVFNLRFSKENGKTTCAVLSKPPGFDVEIQANSKSTN